MAKTNPKKRPFSLWVLIVLVFLIGISALISGPMLFLAPDGHLMMWTTAELEGSPFTDYLIPGLILFAFIGIYPVFVGLGMTVFFRWQAPEAINPFKFYHWAWTAALVVGIIMLIWIAAETLWLGYISFLQPVIAVWGVLIIGLELVPGVRRWFKKS
jgi:hypothetical protein